MTFTRACSPLQPNFSSAKSLAATLSGFPGCAYKKKIPGTLDLFITCTDKRNARGSHFLVLIALIKSQPAAEETGVKSKQWSWRGILSAQR